MFLCLFPVEPVSTYTHKGMCPKGNTDEKCCITVVAHSGRGFALTSWLPCSWYRLEIGMPWRNVCTYSIYLQSFTFEWLIPFLISYTSQCLQMFRKLCWHRAIWMLCALSVISRSNGSFGAFEIHVNVLRNTFKKCWWKEVRKTRSLWVM